jgi:TIR domain-containing protein
MKIFLVWSGNRSFEIAKALHDFLPRMIQAIKPFFSHEIDKGAKWANEIETALEGTRFGIVCLTPDNLNSTWIHFETGALSKTKDALIWTYLSGLNKGDVPQPLGKFQHTVANKDETRKLLKIINKHLNEVGGESLPEPILDDAFEVYWPTLENKLDATMGLDTEEMRSDAVPRKQDAMLEEILELLRSQQRQWNQIEGNIVTIGAKKVSRVSFTIPLEPIGADGAIKKPVDLLFAYAEIFSDKLGGTTTRELGRDGIDVEISFSLPIDRKLLSEAFDIAASASGWRPVTFSMAKI